MNETAFDDLADVYEAMIDWPKRLANEAPFFRRLFEQYGVHRLADVACGTGRHAAMFHSWGLEVQGSDVSPSMIARARQSFGESDRLRWTVQGFDRPMGPPGSFDALVCLGNSLSLARDAAAAVQALHHMFNAVRPGGLVVVHLLNLWKLPDGPCLWQKLTRMTLPQGETLVLKGVHRCADKGYVELVLAALGTNDAAPRSQSVPFLGLKAEELEALARACGAATVACHGNHQFQLYDAHGSTDLIMVAGKA